MTHTPQTQGRPEVTEAEIPGTSTLQSSQPPTDRYRANIHLILSRQADEERMRAKWWWKLRP